MKDLPLKREVVRAMGAVNLRSALWPDWGKLAPSRRKYLLRWLDESGLVLYLLARAEEKGNETIELPETLQAELRIRAEANRKRVGDMISEFRRVNVALQEGGVRYAVLKGFSLIPEFCREASHRHQSDTDILVEEGSIEAAQNVLLKLGYGRAGEEEGGEIRFATPTSREATRDDFLYDPQSHREVEIHRKLFEDANGVSITVASDWAEHIEWRSFEDIRFPSVDLTNRLLLQLLHSFRHILHGWLRAGWLFEISTFAGNEHFADVWSELNTSLVDTRLRNACGIVLALAAEVFECELPTTVRRDWVENLPAKLRHWVDTYGREWVLDDFPGGRLSLLVHKEFTDSDEEWGRFLQARRKRTLRAITFRKLFSAGHIGRWISQQFVFQIRRARWEMTTSIRCKEGRIATRKVP